jgi:hypothetical protein
MSDNRPLVAAIPTPTQVQNVWPTLQTLELSQVVLANLYKHTVLQSRFACNMVALVDGTPLMLNLKQFLSYFLDFRQGPRVLRLNERIISGAATGNKSTSVADSRHAGAGAMWCGGGRSMSWKRPALACTWCRAS